MILLCCYSSKRTLLLATCHLTRKISLDKTIHFLYGQIDRFSMGLLSASFRANASATVMVMLTVMAAVTIIVTDMKSVVHAAVVLVRATVTVTVTVMVAVMANNNNNNNDNTFFILGYSIS